jgi:hypothetical protein
MPPVIAPTVQVKVLGKEAVRLMFGLVPLQITAVAGDVTTGAGLTTTVIVYVAPVQPPAVDVGVTV